MKSYGFEWECEPLLSLLFYMRDISTGMADMSTVETSVKFLSQFTDRIVILHCTSVYPCKSHQLNLRCIGTYIEKCVSVLCGDQYA